MNSNTLSKSINRRQFLTFATALGVGSMLPTTLLAAQNKGAENPSIKLGLVTYQWGKDWDLPTLLKNCKETGYEGIELRCQHAHKVETNLTKEERKEVKKQFADYGITCVGYGSNFEFHANDPEKLRWNIEQAKEYIKLCQEIGASGIKVKPNGYVKGVDHEKTNEQIGVSLNEIGKFAKDYGMLVRVEVHGNETQELPNMKNIFNHVTEKNVVMCWNCNSTDLLMPGLQSNFNIFKAHMGDTAHIREMDTTSYPYQELFHLFKKANYNGWLLLEAQSRAIPADRIAAMKEQRQIFDELMRKA